MINRSVSHIPNNFPKPPGVVKSGATNNTYNDMNRMDRNDNVANKAKKLVDGLRAKGMSDWDIAYCVARGYANDDIPGAIAKANTVVPHERRDSMTLQQDQDLLRDMSLKLCDCPQSGTQGEQITFMAKHLTPILAKKGVSAWETAYAIARCFGVKPKDATAFANKLTGENKEQPDDQQLAIALKWIVNRPKNSEN